MATCLPLGTSPLVLLPLPLQPVAGLFARAAKKLNSIFVQHSQLQSGCSPAAICSSIHSFECLHHRLCVPADGCPAALQFAIKVNLQLQLRQDACSSCRHDSRLPLADSHSATLAPGPHLLPHQHVCAVSGRKPFGHVKQTLEFIKSELGLPKTYSKTRERKVSRDIRKVHCPSYTSCI